MLPTINARILRLRHWTQKRHRTLLALWLGLGALALLIALILPSAKGRAIALGYGASALWLLIGWRWRSWLSARFGDASGHPRRRFLVIGVLGAIWVETAFWAAERAMGAKGIAASPSLWVDWAVTLPWYLMMLWGLWKVETRYAFSSVSILALGGLYEIGADGLFAPIAGGKPMPPLPVYPFFLLGMWSIFMVLYGAMVLPPTWALRRVTEAANSLNQERLTAKRFAYALWPFTGLIPYVAAAVAVGGFR